MNYFSQELGRLIANPYITYPPGRLRPAILQNKTQRLRLRQKELRKLTENNGVRRVHLNLECSLLRCHGQQ